ncbi:hypothetical protein MTR67_004552 [Solanum verrucosum]|uniref:Uncharacterized protein n=1 Tax=Solanum verrucosum TaxID=315347 RepID=A0AAF0T7W4_SOLVR|nr:hypothetical protein MTR67_004552 [Solanum verrucosum]
MLEQWYQSFQSEREMENCPSLHSVDCVGRKKPSLF